MTPLAIAHSQATVEVAAVGVILPSVEDPRSTEARWAFLGAQTLALNGSVILAVVPLLRASKRSSRLPLLYRGL